MLNIPPPIKQSPGPMSTSTTNILREISAHGFRDDSVFLAVFSHFFAVSRGIGATLETAPTGIVQSMRAVSGFLYPLDRDAAEFQDAAELVSR